MNVQLTLSAEDHAELLRRANAAGIDLSSYLQSEVHEILTAPKLDSVQDLPYEHWVEQFQHWLASHTSRNPAFEDSRESIYN